jgi:hypothetical protein
MFGTSTNPLWLRWTLRLCLLFVAWILFLIVAVYLYSFDNETIPADAAIVLGAAVWNKEPSPNNDKGRRRHLSGPVNRDRPLGSW